MMSLILPVVFFTHCRCGPELRPFLMFLPGPVLSEYLANTGVPSRSVSQCWKSPFAVGPSSSLSGSMPPSRAKNPPSSSWFASCSMTFRSASKGLSRLLVFNGEVSFAVVGDSPAFVGVQGFEDGELFAAVGAAWAFFAGVYVLVFPVWAEFLRCWCCHRGLPPLCSRGCMVGFRCGWPWWSYQ